MPQTALVLGAGNMGQAIVYAMEKLGSDVVVIDSSEKAIDAIAANYKNAIGIVSKDLTRELNGIITNPRYKPDVVISSLPYFVNEQAARVVVDCNVPYCDLGGRVDVSQSINDYANEKKLNRVFTDLGLAPGWVNIMAEEGCRSIHRQAEDVEIAVGGLPTGDIDNPLKYKTTWSLDGLYNEYRDDCIVLKDSEIVTVAGMSGLEGINLSCAGSSIPFEKFYTSGGASHTINSMMNKGVKNCSYKTIRYQGHCDIVKFLIFDCKLSPSAMRDIFEKCGTADTDVVLMTAKVKGGNVTWYREHKIHSDSMFSAMQKCTAFPISSIATLLARGYFDGVKAERRDYNIPYPTALTYADVPYTEFCELLAELELEV